MTALEGARRAVDQFDQYKRTLSGRVSADDLADHLRALIAELALYHDHAGLTFPRPLVQGPLTDAQVEAAAVQLFDDVWATDPMAEGDSWEGADQDSYRQAARRALEAARAVQS